MLAKRIIPCLDVRNGKVVKGVNKEMGLYGTICGKRIYTGSLDLTEAVRYANGGI